MTTLSLLRRKACPLCANPNTNELCSLPMADAPIANFLRRFYNNRADIASLHNAQYVIEQCTRCDFIYQREILDDAGMATLYENWVDNARSLEKKRTAGTKLFRQYARIVSLLPRLFPQKPHTVNVLEFGMGWGYWSRTAQAYGYRVNGLELSRERVAHARTLGVIAIDTLPPPGEHYHFIFANQVFEHLPDPLATLCELRLRLIDNGIIYLRVPDGRSIARALMQSGWSPSLDAIHPLEHINCFTRKSLIKLAQAAGLKPVKVPLQLSLSTLWGSAKREFDDRFFTTHIFLGKI